MLHCIVELKIALKMKKVALRTLKSARWTLILAPSIFYSRTKITKSGSVAIRQQFSISLEPKNSNFTLLVKDMEDMTLDELDELEDEEEERILEQYRRARMAEIRALQAKSNYGDVREISAEDYVQQVNKAGDGVWVVLHLWKQGIPLCALMNQYLVNMAAKFPTVKFLRSISTTCIPNYPDNNLPTIFVYFEGEMKASLAGPQHFRYDPFSVRILRAA